MTSRAALERALEPRDVPLLYILDYRLNPRDDVLQNALAVDALLCDHSENADHRIPPEVELLRLDQAEVLPVLGRQALRKYQWSKTRRDTRKHATKKNNNEIGEQEAYLDKGTTKSRQDASSDA